MLAQSISLLLMEDDTQQRQLVTDLVERFREKYRLHVAESMDDALGQLGRLQIQAILLSLRLPDSSGLETLERVGRAAPRSAIIILSSLDDEELAIAAVQQGAQDYLVKSQINSDLLAHSIRYSIERKRHQVELEQLVAERTAALVETNRKLAQEIEEHKLARLRLAEHHQRLLQSERLAAMGEMVEGLAHESRNVLQRSQACLTMLAHRVDDRPKAVELVHRVQQAQDDLTSLFERVRQYAVPTQLDLKAQRLDHLVQHAWDQLSLIWGQRSAKLLMENPPIPPVVQADAAAMEHVFRNVLENALAACQDPVLITVMWREFEMAGSPGIQLVIRDQGPGFNEEQLARMFEPFFSTKAKGTGLGLPISKRFVEAHGGWIRATNCPGGAEVLITLPREGTAQ